MSAASRRWPRVAIVLLLAAIAGSAAGDLAAQSPTPSALHYRYKPQGAAGALVAAGGLAAAADGSHYVMDTVDQRVVHYDADGSFLRSWGRLGKAEGQFDFRSTDFRELHATIGIDVAPDGSVFVADLANHRIQHFTAQGARIGGWGGYGPSGDRLASPVALSVAPDGSVWVNDFHNRRFVRFSADGDVLATWAPASPRPLGFVVAGDGSLYISDAQYNAPAILHHAADGRLLARWPVADTSSDGVVGGVRGPVDLDMAPDGSIVAVVTRAEAALQRFDAATGERIGAWAPRTAEGRAYIPNAVAVAPDGGVLLANPVDRRIERYSLDGEFVGTGEDHAARAMGRLLAPAGLAGDGNGGLLVADRGNDRIQRFDAAGRFDGQLAHLAGPGMDAATPGGSRLAAPADVAVLSDGDWIVADTGNDRVLRVDARGSVERVWGGGGDSIFNGPEGVAVDVEDRIWVADTGHHRIQVIEPDGRLGPAWGEHGSAPGRLDRPRGIAVDGLGDVRVADTGNHRVQVFDASGALRHVLGFHGAGDGQFREASWLAVDRGSRTWVTDPILHRLQRFDDEDRALQGWGFHGQFPSRIGHMDAPSGVTVDAEGGVWVADAALDRIQRFDAGGRVGRVLGDPVAAVGTSGATSFAPEGGLDDVREILVDANGDMLLLGGYPRGRVQRLAADGSYLGSWSLMGRQDHALRGPDAYALGPDGLLHVLENYNDVQRIVQYDRDGAWAGEWDLVGMPSSSSGQLTVAADGSVYVLRSGGRDASHVQRYLPDGSLDATWGNWITYPRPSAIALAPDGEVFLARDHTIERYGPDGDLRGSFGEQGRGPGQLQGECLGCGLSLAIDNAGIVYVGDYGNQRIHRFTRAGVFLDAWGPEYLEELPPWDFPGRFAVAPDGRVVTFNTLAGLRVYGAAPRSTWRATYYGNRWLAERPLAIESIDQENLQLTWPDGPPGPSLAPPAFSARFERWLQPPPGSHELSVTATGGLRLWWGEELLVDDWESVAVEFAVAVTAAGGGEGEVEGRNMVVEFNGTGGEAALGVVVRPVD